MRFVHEAADDQAKADLFAACREGRVAVLIGSTEIMGVGTKEGHIAALVALGPPDSPDRPFRPPIDLADGNRADLIGPRPGRGYEPDHRHMPVKTKLDRITGISVVLLRSCDSER